MKNKKFCSKEGKSEKDMEHKELKIKQRERDTETVEKENGKQRKTLFTIVNKAFS